MMIWSKQCYNSFHGCEECIGAGIFTAAGKDMTEVETWSHEDQSERDTSGNERIAMEIGYFNGKIDPKKNFGMLTETLGII